VKISHFIQRGGDKEPTSPYMACDRRTRVAGDPESMLTTNPFDDDKLHEECGIFGIWGADNAASFVALGLHALQHRGKEAAGITSHDGRHFHSHRAMGHVAGNFDRDDVMRRLP